MDKDEYLSFGVITIKKYLVYECNVDHDPGETGVPDRLTRAAFVREFLNFMAGRHHSDDYDRLFAQA